MKEIQQGYFKTRKEMLILLLELPILYPVQRPSLIAYSLLSVGIIVLHTSYMKS